MCTVRIGERFFTERTGISEGYAKAYIDEDTHHAHTLCFDHNKCGKDNNRGAEEIASGNFLRTIPTNSIVKRSSLPR